jgi:hypothetical protein
MQRVKAASASLHRRRERDTVKREKERGCKEKRCRGEKGIWRGVVAWMRR